MEGGREEGKGFEWGLSRRLNDAEGRMEGQGIPSASFL